MKRKEGSRVLSILLLTNLLIITIFVSATNATENTVQFELVTRYDGQAMKGGYWPDETTTYDGPPADISPGPYPYEFRTTIPSPCVLKIRQALWVSDPDSPNTLEIYVDERLVFNATATWSKRIDGGPTGEPYSIDLGFLISGLHFIELRQTYDNYYLVDWWEVWCERTSTTQWIGPNAPYSVAIDDYNNDGSNDMAYTEVLSEKLSVYKSDGVTLIKQWTGLQSLRGVDIGDYNNDGSNDIAFAQTPYLGGGTVKVYENDGVTLINQWTGLSSPLQISIGDYDNDGLNDLAFTESVSDKVTVYKSDGTTIIKQWTGLVGHPVGVAIGDYDNDGLNDLAFSEFAGNVTVYKSDGVTIIKQWTGRSSPGGVGIGDYDNDGLNDLAFSEYDADTVTVYKSDGLTVISQLTGLSGPYGIAIGDYNNDGSNDLALCEYDANRLIVHYGARAEHELITSLTAPSSITLGGSSLLNATATNRGLSNETNVEFLLLINGATVNSTTIPLLKVDSSYTLSYSWTPAVTGTCNITSYASPVFGETRVKNNQQSRSTTVLAWSWTGTIYIRADGRVDPVTAPILTFDNVTYTLTDDIVGDFPEDSGAIVVERDNIVVDGGGHTVHGTGMGTNLCKRCLSSNPPASTTCAYCGEPLNGWGGDGTGIDLSHRSNVTIKDIRIRNLGYGVNLNSTSQSVVSCNSITNNRVGVLLEHSSNNTIQRNNITDTAHGIRLTLDSSNNTLQGNNITDNIYGITILFSSNNTISGNNVTNNTSEGIYLWEGSSGSIIFGNNIMNNKHGVRIDYSSWDNVLYHNNFIGNTYQVPAFSMQTQIWDDGYPSGGNYWSDYAGVDANGDGIGDTPYVIYQSYTDRYPLVSPWTQLEHELVASTTVPTFLRFGSTLSLNATVRNQGSSDETNVELVLLINGIIVDSSTVPLLQAGHSHTLSYLWTPTAYGAYNVTAYAHPVPGETSTENNQKTKMATVAVSPPPGSKVGVMAGDWIKIDYTISGWLAGTPHPEWLKVEFVSVEGTSATVRVTMHMSDGSEQNATVPVDVVAGGQALGLSGFLIPANCATGDCIYMTGYGNVTIEGETTRTYAGASRTVVYASFSQLGVQLTYYWDKVTGVMVEASTTSGSVTGIGKATETNMWQADSSPFWMQWWFYALVAAIIVALAVTVYFIKRRKPRTPTTPPLPAEGT